MSLQKKIKPVHNGKVVAPGKLDLRSSLPFQLQQTCALNFYFSHKNKSESLSRRELLNDLRIKNPKWFQRDY